MVVVDNAESPFTGNVFHDLETDFAPERRKVGSLDLALVFYRMFLRQEEFFLGCLAQ